MTGYSAMVWNPPETILLVRHPDIIASTVVMASPCATWSTHRLSRTKLSGSAVMCCPPMMTRTVRKFPLDPAAEGGSGQIVSRSREWNTDGFNAEVAQTLDRFLFWDADASDDALHGAVPLEGGPLLQEIVGRQSTEIRHLLHLDVFPSAITGLLENATNAGPQLADAERTTLPATVTN